MDARFHTTHWSLVLAARNGTGVESRAALESLCRAYWFPIYAFIRRQERSPEDASDLTQGYFARLLERRDLDDVSPQLGRFRSFLLASVKHFLANAHDRDRAHRRAPERPLLSLDAQDAEGRYVVEPSGGLTPEAIYERRWAATVLDRTSDRLREEWSGEEKAARFAALCPYLTDDAPAPYRAAGEALGMSEDAVKVAVHRLRRRFGELLRDEITQTVREPAEVDDEIRHLLTVLRS